MIPILERDKKFKEAIGEFIIAFSELEYGLAVIGSFAELDLLTKEENLLNHIGFPFEKKTKHITTFISKYIPELSPIWTKLNIEIGQINRDRRFIAHGIQQYFLPNESITTHIKEKNKIVKRTLTLSEIEGLTNKLHHLNTGENGINGEFHTLFLKHRFDKWNELVNEKFRILYSVNNEVLTQWAGKK